MQITASPAIFLLLLLSRAPSILSCANNRRILHEPFFPLSPPPPVPPTDYNTVPFFPEYPYPPPPPPSTSNQPTFPANLSSIVFPHSHSAPPRGLPSGKLAAAILLPFLALIVISLALAFFLRHHRNNRRGPSTASEKTCFFPARHSSSSSSVGSGCKFPGSPPATDFLYVGTLVGSSGPPDVDPPSLAISPDQKLGSPELRPLPPLSRQFQQNHRNADGGYSSEEEFYSLGKSSPGHGSTSQTEFTPVATDVAMAADKFGSQSETLSSTPSYPSSNSGSVSSPVVVSPPISSPLGASSPETSYPKLLVFGSNRGDVGPRSSPVVVPIPPLRPTTPSPTNRKPVPPSPPSPPHENYSDLKSGNFSSSFLKEKNTAMNSITTSSSAEDLQSPTRNGELSETPVAAPAPSQRKAPPTPPPPPPPPPCGYWESKVRRSHLIQQPDLVSAIAANKCSVSNSHLENSEEKCEEGEKTEESSRPKLKPLHWDKVKASSDRAMVWDQLKTSSFQVNEEMIETLFVCNVANAMPKETAKNSVLPSPKQEKWMLDPKKSQNIAILLRALNATKEEVCESLLEGKIENLGTELLEALLKMAPSKEEEHKLREYKDDSQVKLGTAENFLRGLLDVPFAFKRIDAMLYIANFDSEVKYLKTSFETLEVACEELRSSRLFLKLLEAVLKTGNRMNVGTNRGEACAFKLDTLLKLVDIKGVDGKTTLLHFVVQEIIRAEGSRLLTSHPASANVKHSDAPHDDLKCRKLGLRVVGNLGSELRNVKKAASMDSEVLSSYVSKLAAGVSIIEEVLRLDEELPSLDHTHRFHEAMCGFMKKAEDGIIKVQAQESVAFSLVKEITEYFHGNSAKGEARPLRIFVVVRDFLSILEQVCKEVGKETDHAVVSPASRFPLPVNPSRIRALRDESSEEESSVSS